MARHTISVDVPPTMLDILLQTFADLREATANTTSEDQRLSRRCRPPSRSGCWRNALLHSNFFGDKALQPGTLARSLVGTLVRRVPEDVSILNKFTARQPRPRPTGVKKRKKGEEGGHVRGAERAAKSPEWEAFVAGGKQALSTSFK